MIPKELNEILLKELPEIKDEFLKETDWQDGINTGCTVVFDDVFIPFLINIVESGTIEKRNRVFDFIEKLSNIKDEYVEYVLQMSIFDSISHLLDSDKIIKHFKTNTSKMYKNFIK